MDNMLPIGSVVELKDFKNKVTIIGLLPSFIEDNGIVMYEYVGCEYLRGYSSSKDYVFFDESKINNIYFIGYAIAFDFKFLELLHELYKELGSGKKIGEAIDAIWNKVEPDCPQELEELKKKLAGNFFDEESKDETIEVLGV